ncbi:MAG: VOC family protein [Caldilineaceae bacterium]
MLRKIDAILYRVGDLERAIEFYQEMFGLRLGWLDEERQMAGLLFLESDAEIVLHCDPTLPNPDVSYLVEDVIAFCASYRAAGGVVVVEPFDVRCGKYAIVRDLDGNELGVVDLTHFGGKPRYDVPV